MFSIQMKPAAALAVLPCFLCLIRKWKITQKVDCGGHPLLCVLKKGQPLQINQQEAFWGEGSTSCRFGVARVLASGHSPCQLFKSWQCGLCATVCELKWQSLVHNEFTTGFPRRGVTTRYPHLSACSTHKSKAFHTIQLLIVHLYLQSGGNKGR